MRKLGRPGLGRTSGAARADRARGSLPLPGGRARALVDVTHSGGAEVDPTARAERDQRARHAQEGSPARIAAGLAGKRAAVRRARAKKI
jgi:hypothetical protein